MTNGTEIPTITDKTEVSDNHSLEIEIAALAAVRDICRDITARIVKAVEPKRQIILAGDEALLAAAGYRQLIIHLDLLIDEGEKARTTEATTPSAPATAAPESLAAITGGLTSLVSILDFFASKRLSRAGKSQSMTARLSQALPVLWLRMDSTSSGLREFRSWQTRASVS